MNPVRIAVLGLGAMGAAHAGRLAEGRVPGAVLAAVVDRSSQRRAAHAVPGYADLPGLVAAQVADAVVIASPHRDHPASGSAAIAAGLHVYVEKPLAATAAEARPLVAAARRRRPGQVCAVGFNQRTDPGVQALRALLADGAAGRVQRIAWTVSGSFRSDAYFASGAWRGTWAGEGGGLLINQCAHHLDLWCWLFGPPARVRAAAGFGRWHAIEVEDEVAAVLHQPDGTLGTFAASTGEVPGVDRLEVACDRGLLTLDGTGLRWRRTASAAELRRTSPVPMPRPPVEDLELVAAGTHDQHLAALADFAAAIREGREPLAPLADGLASLELSDAILAAAVLDRTVAVPADTTLLADARERLGAASAATAFTWAAAGA